MKFRMQTEDQTYEAYERMAEELQAQAGKSATAEELMAHQLERFRSVHPADRVVLVDPRNRDRLEQILSGGTLRDAEDLVAKVQKLASLEIGEIRVDWTPGQLRELQEYARRNRKTLQEVVKATVERMGAQFFSHVGNY